VLERLAHPQTRIVSLTITEKGYCLDPGSMKLDVGNPLVAHDLSFPDQRPHSAVGTICAALALRRARGLQPFTVLSCDNLPGNGHLAKAMVLAFLEAREDTELLTWTEKLCPFPNTMVRTMVDFGRVVHTHKNHKRHKNHKNYKR
jgi:mannitol-1-phosphate/altronate dehydrogenase